MESQTSKLQLVLSQACVLCFQRKGKCNREFPCSRCIKSKSQCVPATKLPRRGRQRHRFSYRELLDQIHKYEELLRQNNIEFEPLEKVDFMDGYEDIVGEGLEGEMDDDLRGFMDGLERVMDGGLQGGVENDLQGMVDNDFQGVMSQDFLAITEQGLQSMTIEDEQKWAKIKDELSDGIVDNSNAVMKHGESKSFDYSLIDFDFQFLASAYRDSVTLFTTLDEFESRGLCTVPPKFTSIDDMCTICQRPLSSPSPLGITTPRVPVHITIQGPDLIMRPAPLPKDEEIIKHVWHFSYPSEVTEITNCNHTFHRMCLNKQFHGDGHVQEENKCLHSEHSPLPETCLFPTTLTSLMVSVPSNLDIRIFRRDPIILNNGRHDRRPVLYSLRLFHRNLIFSGHLRVTNNGQVELSQDGLECLHECCLSLFRRHLDPRTMKVVKRVHRLNSAWTYFHQVAETSYHDGELHLLKGMSEDMSAVR